MKKNDNQNPFTNRESRQRHTCNTCWYSLIFFLLSRILVEQSSDQKQQYALIVDGQSLAFAMLSCSKELQELCLKLSTVLCCRMSPLQKAQVKFIHKKIFLPFVLISKKIITWFIYFICCFLFSLVPNFIEIIRVFFFFWKCGWGGIF